MFHHNIQLASFDSCRVLTNCQLLASFELLKGCLTVDEFWYTCGLCRTWRDFADCRRVFGHFRVVWRLAEFFHLDVSTSQFCQVLELLIINLVKQLQNF